MELKNKTVLVAGTGISGIGATKLLTAVGAQVILYDSNEALTKEEILGRFDSPLPQVSVITGELLPKDMEGIDLAVLSPGVPVDAPFVKAMAEHHIKIWGEIELAYHYAKGVLAAITGTNGKTTTTALTGEIMKAWCEHVFVVGNIGNSYTQSALETTDDSVTVAEISSFQLATIQDFHPHVAAVLNITPDHLNRHHTMECYINTKKRIFENQDESDFTVLNYDDEITRAMAEDTRGKVIFFSGRHVLEEGYYFKDGEILWTHDHKCEHICYDSDLNILGLHNMENVMAAVAIATCLGVPKDVIFKALTQFKAVEHRIEYVTEKKGVYYYNDSKGTNPDAAIKAVEAMVRPTLLIGGGYDKQSEYDEWIQSFEGRVRLLVLLGQTADKIEACARAHGFDAIIRVESLEDAVRVCAEHARPGDAVLLSPACASWGMFKNYEERGRLFKQYVQQLED
ncbi:MAG TPA: UDP-N-acetylmuramoyl-L-alanine--D-glutamate ligase [Candidatus Scybalocola faecavium]|nr:UDP-N-acetylmuramoyl-L-alanine--D-glutamate ligase [Candidatus Scybalocola faecavium]